MTTAQAWDPIEAELVGSSKDVKARLALKSEIMTQKLIMDMKVRAFFFYGTKGSIWQKYLSLKMKWQRSDKNDNSRKLRGVICVLAFIF